MREQTETPSDCGRPDKLAAVEGASDVILEADGSRLSTDALVARYSAAKARSSSIAKWLQQQDDDDEARRQGRKVGACWSWMVIRDYWRLDRRRVIGAASCHRPLLCPACAIRRARRFVGAYLARIAAVLDASPELAPYVVTLTVRNGEDLGERYDHLRRLVRALGQRRREQRNGRAWTEWARLEGAFLSYEFTRGRGGWHPHAHALALMSSAPDDAGDLGRWPALSEEVLGITGDSFIVDARRVEGEPIAAVCEVAKYALKFSSLSPADTWRAFQTLRGRRLVESFGCLRGVEVPDDDDELELEDEPFRDLVFRWLLEAGAYSFQGTRGAVEGEHTTTRRGA